MILKRYREVVIEPKLLTPTFVISNLPQQTVNIALTTENPIEEIQVALTVTIKSDITAFVADHALNLLRRVRLSVTEPAGPRIPVDVSGPGLVELASFEGDNLDPATNGAILYGNNNNAPQGAVLRIFYRIPVAHPRFTDTLRMRTLLPAHLLNESPILTLEFGQASDVSGTADPISTFACEVKVVRRRKTAEFLSKGGGSLEWFIRSWLGEASNNLAVSLSNAEQRIQLPTQGQISGMVLRYFKGNATMARATIDDVTTIGAETIWRIEQGGVPITKFRLKDLQLENQLVKPHISPAQIAVYGGLINHPDTGDNTADGVTSGAPALVTAKQIFAATGIGGALAAGQCIQDPASVFLDFSGSPGREIYETGSFLDVSTPTANKQKTELVGTVTTPSNQQSIIKVVTRLFEDKVNELAAL